MPNQPVQPMSLAPWVCVRLLSSHAGLVLQGYVCCIGSWLTFLSLGITSLARFV
jgi:hypothetical protein